VLEQLCPEVSFDKIQIHKIYIEIGRLHGRWSAEQSRLDIAPLESRLNAIARSLDTIVNTLNAHQTGFREIHDIKIVSQLAKILSANPEIDSRQRADELIASFQKDAAKISDACRIAAADFGWDVGKGGRPKLDWYDDFTSLLVEIARKGAIKPRLGKDRITGVRTGWLLRAARELETFFDPEMRSPDAEACGKRLERSRRTIKQQVGQNPSPI
jgi:hypothetical protein